MTGSVDISVVSGLRRDSTGIQDVVVRPQTRRGMFSLKATSVKNQKMPDFDLTYCSEGQNRRINPTNENLALDSDLAMERIIENIHNTPIGQVLKNIASLPEIRKNKVLNLRQQLTEGRYDLGERLDVALDRVLEDLTA